MAEDIDAWRLIKNVTWIILHQTESDSFRDIRIRAPPRPARGDYAARARVVQSNAEIAFAQRTFSVASCAPCPPLGWSKAWPVLIFREATEGKGRSQKILFIFFFLFVSSFSFPCPPLLSPPALRRAGGATPFRDSCTRRVVFYTRRISGAMLRALCPFAIRVPCSSKEQT